MDMWVNTNRNAVNLHYTTGFDMKKEEIKTAFFLLCTCCALPKEMKSYSNQDWENLINMWCDVFVGIRYNLLHCAILRYIKEGGKYFPYPGEIAGLLPFNKCISDEDACRLDYQTVAQKKAQDKAFDDNKILKPYGG